jgi:hypothetical protein
VDLVGGPPSTMYRRIVLVLCSIPNLSFISKAMRSSPQLGFCDDRRLMNSMCRLGIRGRPRLPFDFQRQ